jgi:AraC-like DNA-binding protein
VSSAPGTLGILNPQDGFKRFALDRYAPGPELLPFVENYWSVRWNLPDAAPFEQEILPHPCVNLAFEAERSAVHGPGTRRFVAHLSGQGRVLGVKFKAAGFLPFAGVPLTEIVDRVLPIDEALGRHAERVSALIASVLADDDAVRNIALIEAFLLEGAPRLDEDFALVERLVALTRSDRAICRAEQLARVASLSVRSLHRLFERHVGVGPKWIICRSRVQEAAERVASGNKVDWAALAQELGYHDQSHLVRDFKDQVGLTPAAYASRCEAATHARAQHAAALTDTTEPGAARLP